MPTTAIALLFLATAPIHLLPAILAVFLRTHDRAWVVAANLVLWIGFPLPIAAKFPVQIGLIGTLILWLLLLRLVLNRTTALLREVGGLSSKATGGVEHTVLAPPNKSLERTRGS
jgi:hypothetical protein